MAAPLHLLYIDPVHQADPLFWQGLGRILAGAGPQAPACLLVHGSGDRLERLLEARGETAADGSALPPALVERVLRMETHRLVGLLTDTGVSAVGVQGSDRGVLRIGPGGDLRAPGAAWLADLAGQRAVPVVSAHVAVRGEVPLEAVVVAIVKALRDKDIRVVFFTRADRPGIVEKGAIWPVVALDDARVVEGVACPEAVAAVASAGAEVWLTSPVGLIRAGGLQGTRVVGTGENNAISA